MPDDTIDEPGSGTVLPTSTIIATPPGAASPVPAPEAPTIRYPPFPPVPSGVTILPYKQFKEHGIQIFGSEPDGTGIEIDGLGIPTIELRVPHATDECKTDTKRKKRKNGDDDEKGKGKELTEEEKIKREILKKDPVARAQEQKRQRLLLFAKKQWYDQWAEGEDLRGTRTYASNLSPSDRIHMAATEFRTGRIWPPTSTRVSYLWDQFRLYTGLLGQPPIWIRTDRLPVEGSDDDEAIDSDTEIVGGPTTTGKTTDVDVDDDMESEDDFFDISPPSSPLAKPSKLPDEQSQYQSSYDQPHKFKRLPPRTPYFFHNATPARVSSDEQVLKLLRLSTLRKENKLLSFLAAPDTSIKIFLSWYIRNEGLVWSPLHLHALPKLVLFFLEFLVRARVIPEADRALRRAVEIARKAVEEVPRTGKLCRMMPDKVSMGGRSCWGIQWEEDNWMSEVEIQKEAEKRFEEELKAANVEVVAASDIVPPEPKVDAEDDLYGLTRNIALEKSDDEGEGSVEAQQIPQPPTMFSRPSGEIDIRVMSPTSPGFYDIDTPSVFGSAFIEEVHESEARIAAVAAAKDREESAGQDEAHIAPIPAPGPSPKAVSTAIDLGTITEPLSNKVATHTFTAPNWALAPEDPQARPPPKHGTAENVEENTPMPWDWNIDDPSSSANLASKQASDREAWFPPEPQPFMELLGMTTLPLKFEPGVVERSMRKVREVLIPGSVTSGRDDRRWKGVQEELVNRLARVVLEPWVDWDNGGVSTEYTSPKIQMPKGKAKEPKPGSSSGVEEGNLEGSQHDPEKDNITILVEPQVAEHVSIGMGFAGTWVQLAPIPVEGRDSCGVFGGGRGGPRGRGHGRGGRGGSAGGRGGAPSDGLGSTHAPPLDSAPVNSQSAVPSEPSTQVDPTESSVSTRGRGSGRGGRGRGRGGGGSYQHPTHEGSQKEFTFWYVEGLFMVIPSFWTVGVEEEPLTMPEGGDGDLSDMED